MPFTPLHMGPGLAIKALAGRRFSLLAFGVAQVAMDIEPLVGMASGATVLHGASHTYLAALFIAVAVAVITPSIGRPILGRWNRELLALRLAWLVEPEAFRTGPVVAGAVIGTVSHLMFDSVMHLDVTPLAPWSDANALFHLVSVSALHQFCLLSGLFGFVAWLLLARFGRRREG